MTKLRRPTIAAWAVNQTVRRHRDRVAALLDAGQDVRRAQRRAMSGVRQSGLREATRTRRQLIDGLTDLAAGILTDQGSNAETHRADIAATFDAASSDDDAASTVSAAQLAAPLPVTSGFGGFEGLSILPTPEQPVEPEEPAGTDEDAEAAERERAAQRRREAIRAVEDARRRVAQAEAEAQRATNAAVTRAAAADEVARTAREAEQMWRRRQREADDLQMRLAGAREDAAAAEHAVEQALADLRAREGELNNLDGAG